MLDEYSKFNTSSRSSIEIYIMRDLRRTLALIALLSWSALAPLSAEEQLVPLATQTLSRLEGVALSAEQVVRVGQLAVEFGRKIELAESAAQRTETQRQLRDQAIKQAIAAGCKGVEARNFIARAGVRTKGQIAAAKNAAALRSSFESAILALLTEAQRATLNFQVNKDRAVYDDSDEGEYSGFIIVRLSPELPDPSDQSQTLFEVIQELGLTSLAEVLDNDLPMSSRRVVPGILRQELLAARDRPEQARLLRRLRSYWRVDFRQDQVRIDDTLARLNKLPEVDLAYRELTVSEPAYAGSVMAADDPFNYLQGYLDPAPLGIDARYAWSHETGQGKGVGLVDLERGWNLDHEDFACKAPMIVHGDNLLDAAGHGTAVLGQIVADDNTVGVVGIAPAVDYVFLTGRYDAVTNSTDNTAKAIYAVLPLMCTGDVLLLEVCRGKKEVQVPTEVDDADFDAISLAVLQGITVVEAAGNLGVNLDAYKSPKDGKLILNRGDRDFRDSGAIMVGAADATCMHDRIGWSSFGSRVDCYGWGRGVITAGLNGDLDYASGDANKQYTSSFNGTSAAAPIIAGAAIIVQGMSKANSGIIISPMQMRAMLSNPATGTPQGPGMPGNIGVMPNLKLIIEQYFGNYPPPRRDAGLVAIADCQAELSYACSSLNRSNQFLPQSLRGCVRRLFHTRNRCR